MADKKTTNRAHRAPDDGSGGAGKDSSTGEPRQTTGATTRNTPETDHRARFFIGRDTDTDTGYDPNVGW
jgi:hypothetical protein